MLRRKFNTQKWDAHVEEKNVWIWRKFKLITVTSGKSFFVRISIVTLFFLLIPFNSVCFAYLRSFLCQVSGAGEAAERGEGRETSNENLWWSVDPVSSKTFQQKVINCSMCSEISLLVLNWGINMSPRIHHNYHNFTSLRQRTFNLMENSSLPDEWRRLHCYHWDCAPIFIQICRIPFAVSKAVSAFFVAPTHKFMLIMQNSIFEQILLPKDNIWNDKRLRKGIICYNSFAYDVSQFERFTKQISPCNAKVGEPIFDNWCDTIQSFGCQWVRQKVGYRSMDGKRITGGTATRSFCFANSLSFKFKTTKHSIRDSGALLFFACYSLGVYLSWNISSRLYLNKKFVVTFNLWFVLLVIVWKFAMKLKPK